MFLAKAYFPLGLRTRHSLRQSGRWCVSWNLGVQLSPLLSLQTSASSVSAAGGAAAATTAVLFAERAPRSTALATSSLGEPTPFSGMVSQPYPASG